MEDIMDHRSLIDRLGGNTVVAANLNDCTPIRVGQWKIGNRIPVEYWPGIIEMARGIDGMGFVTSDWLMNTVRPRKNSADDSPPSDVAAA